MKILYIADGRSPTALNWISYFVDQGHEVHLVSMFACQPDLSLASISVVPIAFSEVSTVGKNDKEFTLHHRIIKTLASPRLRTWLRHKLVPQSLPKAAAALEGTIAHLQPDIIHAMRIPYEGMTASIACEAIPNPPPFLVSVWGNDFTLHAPSSRKLGKLTRQTLTAADGLHTDCFKDQQLARVWGFDSAKSYTVLPGAGGIQIDTFTPGHGERDPVVINPRGMRAYIRNDTFFKSIPIVLERYPMTKFICPAMEGMGEAEKWVKVLGISKAVQLLPKQRREDMADLFRQAQVVISPSTHDGTPNTVLEAMACGCFPVVGDLDSLREWIIPGMNGLMFDPGDPQAMAEAICLGLENTDLRSRGQEINQELIKEKAEFGTVMEKAAGFYQDMIEGNYK